METLVHSLWPIPVPFVYWWDLKAHKICKLLHFAFVPYRIFLKFFIKNMSLLLVFLKRQATIISCSFFVYLRIWFILILIFVLNMWELLSFIIWRSLSGKNLNLWSFSKDISWIFFLWLILGTKLLLNWIYSGKRACILKWKSGILYLALITWRGLSTDWAWKLLLL